MDLYEREPRSLVGQPQKPSGGDNDTKDNNKVLCFNYKELGHYSSKCPKGNNRAKT
jgi:hypothetical protein